MAEDRSETAGRTLGFVGLGVMGTPMAANLLRHGARVQVFDLDAAAVDGLTEAGAIPATSGAGAAEGADAVFVSLPDGPQVQDALFAAGGVVEGVPSGGVVVDLGTTAANTAREIAERLDERGLAFVDAPVSGGVTGAKAGTLSIMAGGTSDAYTRVAPYLACLGRSVHVGDVGMGQVFKSCNQIVCAVNIQALCEAFALARSQGADLSLLREVMLGGAASSWMLDNLAPQMIAGDAGAGFRIELQLKDLRLATQTAYESGVPLPAAMQVTALYLEALAHGEGANGNHGLFRVYDRLTGQSGGDDS